MIDGNQLREEFGRYLAEHKATRWGMDAALMHVCKIAYDAGKADGPGATGRFYFGGVTYGECDEWEFDADQGVCDRINESAPEESRQRVYLLLTYGAACRAAGEAAGYARGLKEAGRDAERYRAALAELLAVKDIKARSEACWPGDPEIPVLMREYSTRKDAAWTGARAALAEGEVKP